MFKYNVLNYDFNKHRVEFFNIFQNWVLDEAVEKEVKKYLSSPRKYGWDNFVNEINSLISWQECGRCEYEISANEKFAIELEDVIREAEKYSSLEDFKNYLKTQTKRYHRSQAFDCYDQAHANIETICYEIIRQYKEARKNA